MNFFEQVRDDTEKIHQFMEQSELQEINDGDHIVKIIEKAKKEKKDLTENSLMKK